MKINYNGIIREMTPEEEKEWKKTQPELPVPNPSPEERLQKLEAENKELKAMIQKLSEV